MDELPDTAWFARFQQRVNHDEEMAVIGDWFSLTFSLTFGEHRVALRVREGKIEEIIDSPKFDIACAFGFRAPEAVWKKFLSPEPIPLYHDFFAMLMRVPEFVIDGDSLAAMQNARALHRLMNIMKTMNREAAEAAA